MICSFARDEFARGANSSLAGSQNISRRSRPSSAALLPKGEKGEAPSDRLRLAPQSLTGSTQPKLGADTGHQIVRPIINCRVAVLTLRHRYRCRSRGGVSGGIAYLEGDRIDAPVSIAIAFGAQLN